VRYTWDQMMDEAKKLAERYPDIISLSSIGQSVEGRDLLLIKLGKGEKKILLCGTHHAREYISSSYLMRMTEAYARAWESKSAYGNYDVAAILDKMTITIVPMVNPDGVNLVNNGLKAVTDQEAVAAMAMVRSSYREWKANINGVDLNRQYPAHWEEKYDNVGKPASENYKGPTYASEPEIKAMMALTREEDFILAASFHTKGNMIFWADSGTYDLIPGVKDMAKRMSKLTGYELMPVSEKPSVYGAGYENWFRLEFKRPAFCIELTYSNGTDVPHDDTKFDSLVWSKAKYLGLFLADEALKR
jgi:predicted deacylase